MSIRKKVRTFFRRFTGTITRVNTSEQVVALTFDDGPDPEFTPKLLDVLERHNAKATFFMVGKLADKYPDLVAEVARRGHVIGNHSWDHASFPLLNRLDRIRQIKKCSRALAPYGHRLFRPPFGHQNLASRLDAAFLGYRVIAWNILVDDWMDLEAAHILDKLKEQIKPGSIILLHDSLYCASQSQYFDRSPTLSAVDRLLGEYVNYEFVTVSELFNRGGIIRRAWYQKGDIEWLASLRSHDNPQP